MRTPIIITLLSLSIAAATTNAQAPEPVVVQASGPTATAPTAGSAADGQEGASKAVLLKALQQLKAANDEIVKRQLATLQQLEEIEKAAAEIKIFAGRS